MIKHLILNGTFRTLLGLRNSHFKLQNAVIGGSTMLIQLRYEPRGVRLMGQQLRLELRIDNSDMQSSAWK